MKIFIDAGHGDHDPGAVAELDGKKYIEKDLNLSIALELEKLLDMLGHRVFMSRHDDTFLTPGARAREANKVDADLMVSIHHNSFSKESANGMEVLHYPNNEEGKNLAASVLKEMIKEFGLTNRGTKARDNLSVLNKTTMTSILVECLFISSPKDTKKIDENYSLRMASVIYNGISEHYNWSKTVSTLKDTPKLSFKGKLMKQLNKIKHEVSLLEDEINNIEE